MKFHYLLFKAVAEVLITIFENNKNADFSISDKLKQDKRWGARDRYFIAENTYEIVRWWRLATETLDEEKKYPMNYYFRIVGVWKILGGYELPDWKEFEGLDRNKILARGNELKLIRKFRESIPDWLDEICVNELGENVWTKELAVLNTLSRLIVRANSLKTNANELQQLFQNSQIVSNRIEKFEDALEIQKRTSLYVSNEFMNGLFEVQDASSQLVAPFMNVEEGMTVIDACAGAGGKALHLAALMKNKGNIIAMDVEEKKIKALNLRANRAGATIIKSLLIDKNQIENLKNTADRLLLDVPCTGLGVLRRKPFDKWKLSEEILSEKKLVQQNILQNYSSMLKPGGKLVYATCSILPSENEKQIELFLKKNKNKFEFEEERKVMPSEGYDGFYMARLKRI